MSNQTNSEYQKAIDYLYQMASDGQLIVGSKIPSERELAQKTGISRNSTREAISILRGIGIVESRHGSGNYVSKDPGSSISMMIKAMLALKSTSKAEIIQVRKVISYSVCELIMDRGLTKEEVADFQSILDGMITASKEEFAEYDRIFHRKLMLLTDKSSNNFSFLGISLIVHFISSGIKLKHNAAILKSLLRYGEILFIHKTAYRISSSYSLRNVNE